MAAGQVVEWKERGFGFLRPDAGGRDVFFHATDVVDTTKIAIGVRVTYDLAGASGLRPKATNVQAETSPPQEDALECEIISEAEFREMVAGLISTHIKQIEDDLVAVARRSGWLE